MSGYRICAEGDEWLWRYTGYVDRGDDAGARLMLECYDAHKDGCSTCGSRDG